MLYFCRGSELNGILRTSILKPICYHTNTTVSTCILQVNLDFHSEADMIRKFRAGLALQPVSFVYHFTGSLFSFEQSNTILQHR